MVNYLFIGNRISLLDSGIDSGQPTDTGTNRRGARDCVLVDSRACVAQ